MRYVVASSVRSEGNRLRVLDPSQHGAPDALNQFRGRRWEHGDGPLNRVYSGVTRAGSTTGRVGLWGISSHSCVFRTLYTTCAGPAASRTRYTAHSGANDGTVRTWHFR